MSAPLSRNSVFQFGLEYPGYAPYANVRSSETGDHTPEAISNHATLSDQARALAEKSQPDSERKTEFDFHIQLYGIRDVEELGGAMGRAYEKARKALKACVENPDPPNWHRYMVIDECSQPEHTEDTSK